MSAKLRVVASERSACPVLELLDPFLAQGVLPEDVSILRSLVPNLPPDVGTLLAIEELVRAGELRRVIIGTEPHLVRGRGSAPTATTTTTGQHESDVDFDTELAIDVESERIVLYRVAGVVLFLGLVAIAREWLLILLT